VYVFEGGVVLRAGLRVGRVTENGATGNRVMCVQHAGLRVGAGPG
jgi:hypothetical protein